VRDAVLRVDEHRHAGVVEEPRGVVLPVWLLLSRIAVTRSCR
jgi:hypothetical protein